MPRGQKSKLRSREERRQARGQSQDLGGAQATVAEEEGAPSSSSSFVGGTPQSLPAAGSGSKPQGPRRAPSTATTSVGVPCTRADDGVNCQDEESPSTSQALPTTDHSGRTPLDDKAVLLMQFLLHKYNKREPITKEDMLRCVIKKYKDHFQEILKKASELMVLAFGIDVKEIDPARHCYALVSKLQHNSDGRLSGEEIMPKSGLLMTVLCVIFMKGNCATEEEIWEVLNVMGIYAGKNHFIHGEPKKLLTKDLVKERYLEYRQVPDSKPPRYKFLWGPRAHAETSKMKILEFLAKIHDTVPSAFPAWYEEAVRDEEERARARFAAMFCTTAMAIARSRANSSSFSYP
ncbi:LOW QUALITY PROTEIN: melanoma-associated antigen B18-like [Choloepus didactylus]|uniref:LOW QUALITY PROTEIN: melanoma-associated antigen B18-like n=1 Tax=Choloepus didactylus TaxID=27675 RepID=UPI00189DF914|nr:LOW QUALITY PROTEIN: melanoma-associated antigen B18-like [Choloepus didactylus]